MTGKMVGKIPHIIQRQERPRNKLDYLNGLQYHRDINIPKRTAN